MGSTVRSLNPPSDPRQFATGSLRWRSWPVLDHLAWSWLLPLGIALVGLFVFWTGRSLLLAVVAMFALAVAMWSVWLPTTFEVTSLGLRRKTPRRIRLIPWTAIRSYQLRTTGAMLFQQPEPSPLDIARGLFVPYPPEPDELVVALRFYLPHASELPK